MLYRDRKPVPKPPGHKDLGSSWAWIGYASQDTNPVLLNDATGIITFFAVLKTCSHVSRVLTVILRSSVKTQVTSPAPMCLKETSIGHPHEACVVGSWSSLHKGADSSLTSPTLGRWPMGTTCVLESPPCSWDPAGGHLRSLYLWRNFANGSVQLCQ